MVLAFGNSSDISLVHDYVQRIRTKLGIRMRSKGCISLSGKSSSTFFLSNLLFVVLRTCIVKWS